MKKKRVKFKARIKLSHNTYALVQPHKIHMLISSIPFGRVFMIMNLKQKNNKIFIQGSNQTRTYSVHVCYLIRFIKETSTLTLVISESSGTFVFKSESTWVNFLFSGRILLWNSEIVVCYKTSKCEFKDLND